MFKIYIYDPENFYASMIINDTAVYDTQLFYLMKMDIVSLEMIDYYDTFRSYLSSFDGESEIYFLAISS